MQATLEPFVAEHGVEILGREARDYLSFLLRCQYEGPAFTARLTSGELLACAGFVEEMTHSASAWLIPTHWIKMYPVLFHRLVLLTWADMLREHTWQRVQTLVDPKFPERVGWIERLGFVREGIQRAGSPDGHDLWYYGWLRSDGHGTASNRHRSDNRVGSGGGGVSRLRRPGAEEGCGL